MLTVGLVILSYIEKLIKVVSGYIILLFVYKGLKIIIELAAIVFLFYVMGWWALIPLFLIIALAK